MRIPPARIYFSDEDRAEILKGIDEALRSGQLTLGKWGKTFEEEIARFIGTKHAIVVNSGTSSIQIPMHIYNVKGKEVIVPTNTFFATALGVMHAGGIVRFVDCDPETFSVDMESLRGAINERTAGVVVVHIGGIVTPHMQEIAVLCREPCALYWVVITNSSCPCPNSVSRSPTVLTISSGASLVST